MDTFRLGAYVISHGPPLARQLPDGSWEPVTLPYQCQAGEVLAIYRPVAVEPEADTPTVITPSHPKS